MGPPIHSYKAHVHLAIVAPETFGLGPTHAIPIPIAFDNNSYILPPPPKLMPRPFQQQVHAQKACMRAGWQEASGRPLDGSRGTSISSLSRTSPGRGWGSSTWKTGF